MGTQGDESAMNLESVTAYVSLATLGCASDALWDGFYRLQVGPRKLGQRRAWRSER